MSDGQALLDAAQNAQSEQRWSDAVVAWKIVLEKKIVAQPQIVFLNMAICEDNSGNSADAVKSYDKALALDASYVAARLNKVATLLKLDVPTATPGTVIVTLIDDLSAFPTLLESVVRSRPSATHDRM